MSAASWSRLDGVFAATLRLADRIWLQRRRVVLVGAPVLVGILVAIGALVLRQFPNSGDEYVYLYQAETLALGRLWNPTPAEPDAFRFNYIVQDGDRTYGSFPIGWPLMLAGAMLVGLPAWLVNPLLGAATLILAAALTTRLYGPRAGVLAAALIGTTPFFLFNGASYYSHTFCGVLFLGAAYVAVRSGPASVGGPLTIGFLLAWAVLARYFTGVIGGVVIVATLLLRQRQVSRQPSLWPAASRFLLVCLGALPWVVVLLLYNDAMTGNPLQLTTLPTTVDLWFRPGFALKGADILVMHLLRLVNWTPPALLFIYVYYLCAGPRARHGVILEWMPVAMAGTLYFYIERGGNQFGPRFYYETFLFVAIFVAGRLARDPLLLARPRAERGLIAALVLSVLALPIAFVTHAIVEHTVITERMDPYRMVAARGGGPALVFISGRVGSLRSMGALDLTRNELTYDGATVYALDDGVARDCAVAAVYPGRALYLYRWNHEQARGELTPLHCARD